MGFLHSIRHIENRNKGYKGPGSTLNIFGLAGGCTHTLYVSKIFSRELRAYSVIIISYLTLGKLIPSYFVIPYALLNIFGLAGAGTYTLYVSKIFSRELRAYWMTIISYLTLGKLIPSYFVIPYALLNIFGLAGVPGERAYKLISCRRYSLRV